MKKIVLLLIVGLAQAANSAFAATIAINSITFPDANFRSFIQRQSYGTDGYLTDAEIASVTSIDVSSKQIEDLKGIEYFTALTYLYCSINQLTSLDVSKNTALKELQCNSNQLTSLDVSQNTKLTYLYCSSNQLTSLDVSKNTALKGLYCNSNQLTSLDVSKNTALEELFCSSNQLTSLDVSKNTALETLRCSSNQLTSLDVSKNTALKELQCNSNQLTSLDVSQNTALRNLDCRNNQLTSLNVSQNTALKYLYCYSNQIRYSEMQLLVNSLPTVSNMTFYVYDAGSETEGNEISNALAQKAKDKGWKVYAKGKNGTWVTDYDFGDFSIEINSTNFPDYYFRNYLLSQSYGTDGFLTEAEIAEITTIDVAEKNISSLKGIEYFTALKALWCNNNQLTSLDVTKNTALTSLSCNSNQLTSLDVLQNTALTVLECYNNRLTSLDVSKNTALAYLYCHNNQLTTLDMSQNKQLRGLDCYGNQIKYSEMQQLVSSLPTVTNRELRVYDADSGTDGNEISNALAQEAGGKGWKVYAYKNGTWLTDYNFDVIGAIAINSTNFPDYYFRNYLLSQSYGTDGFLTLAEIAEITRLSLNLLKVVSSLKGIEYFTALTTLECSGNQLTTLDVSKNTKLTYLSCSNNQLTTLDVSKNTALTKLYCQGNQIQYSEMQQLVGSLPIVTNGEFRVYNADSETEGNEISNDQAQIAKDKGWNVYAYKNGTWVTDYDFGNFNIAINSINFPDYYFRNYLRSQSYGTDGWLTEAEIASVTSIDVSSKQIEDLKGIEYFTALEKLFCNNNQLPSLDVSKNTKLTELNCSYNLLTALDVKKNTALMYLYCNNNQLTSLDVSQNTALLWLYCSNNQLTSLDVSKNTALTELDCYYNQLTSLDVSKNTKLIYLACENNQIKYSEMQKLVGSLPTVTNGDFYVYDAASGKEGNEISNDQVKIANDKGWTVYAYNGSKWVAIIRGDTNLDGTVDIADVVTILNAMASDSKEPIFDVNGDTKVDIADVVSVLNLMADQ